MTGVGGGAPPRQYALHQNLLNPFNPATVIRYDIPVGGGRVALRVFDTAGRLVRNLIDEEQTAGSKQVTWYGLNDHGQPIASGVYFCRMSAPGFNRTLKMVLLQ